MPIFDSIRYLLLEEHGTDGFSHSHIGHATTWNGLLATESPLTSPSWGRMWLDHACVFVSLKLQDKCSSSEYETCPWIMLITMPKGKFSLQTQIIDAQLWWKIRTGWWYPKDKKRKKERVGVKNRGNKMIKQLISLSIACFGCLTVGRESRTSPSI